MTTRMNILTEKYIKFYNDINLINNSYSHLFPSLEDIDMVDLFFFSIIHLLKVQIIMSL